MIAKLFTTLSSTAKMTSQSTKPLFITANATVESQSNFQLTGKSRLIIQFFQRDKNDLMNLRNKKKLISKTGADGLMTSFPHSTKLDRSSTSPTKVIHRSFYCLCFCIRTILHSIRFSFSAFCLVSNLSMRIHLFIYFFIIFMDNLFFNPILHITTLFYNIPHYTTTHYTAH